MPPETWRDFKMDACTGSVSNLPTNAAMMNPFSQESEMDKMCGGFNLSRTERFIGFGSCYVIGFVISFMASLSLFSGNVGMFAVLYSFGNIISLLSTGFLVGFASQFKKMFDATRRTAALVFFAVFFLTLASAFTLKIGIITLLLCIIQFAALMWYSIRYILHIVSHIVTFHLQETQSKVSLEDSSNKHPEIPVPLLSFVIVCSPTSEISSRLQNISPLRFLLYA